MSAADGPEIGASRDETQISDDSNNENNGGGVVLESNANFRVTDEIESDEGEDNGSEAGGGVGVSDLVWGKVRSHPWWPGQIFDPSDASEKARRYSKKDGFLIAYFGDKTFAWNEAAKIKPFMEHFVHMERQSGTESFCHAVECALGEVSRRVEFGLACKCLSEEVYGRIKTQNVVNAGIREESSRREGGDGYSSSVCFVPLNLVGYVQNLAKSPCAETDKLEFVTARAQLLSFNRHQGFPELPEFLMFGGLVGDGVEHASTENNGDVPLGKEIGFKGSSRKRKKIYSNSISTSEEEINTSDLMYKSHTSLSAKKHKADTYGTDSTMVEEKKDSFSSVTQNRFSDVGKRICSVIPALKDEGNGSLLRSCRRAGIKKATPAEHASPDEILAHLCAAARCPIKGYSSLCSSISFLSDMRNLSSLDKSEHEMESEKSSIKEDGEDLPKGETGEASGTDGFEDSYWTDRVVLTNTQERDLFESDTPTGNTIKPETPNGNGIASAELDPNLDPKVETAGHIDDKYEEENPTALILNFTDIESVPTQQNLNIIFRRYGPLKETGTEVLKRSKRAKVIFKRRSDAETAFSSSGKFSIFGPSLVSYRLHYLPDKQGKGSPAKKRSKKGANPLEEHSDG